MLCRQCGLIKRLSFGKLPRSRSGRQCSNRIAAGGAGIVTLSTPRARNAKETDDRDLFQASTTFVFDRSEARLLLRNLLALLATLLSL